MSNALRSLSSALLLLVAAAPVAHAASAAPAASPQLDPAAAREAQERGCDRLLARASGDPRLRLERAEDRASDTVYLRGRYLVPEDRDTGEGRQIALHLLILPARGPERAPDPVFLLHGGPGAAAPAFFGQQRAGWIVQRRDVVLIDQRGTGRSNPLRVPQLGDDEDLQSYFTSYFDPERYAAALPELQARADLSQYTTPNAIDDFEEVRAALGYQQVNLRGGSYGSRAALVWLRRHPESVRTAMLMGVAPIAYRNPLPHARGAQDALDLIFAEIRAEPRYAAAFPDLEQRLWQTLGRLEQEPAEVDVRHPETGEVHTIRLDHKAFAEAVRLQLYQLPSNRRLPLLLLRAHAGDYREFAEASLAMSRGLRGAIAWGALMCVTGSEDIPRIDPAEIEAACAGTFLGETRVREQMAVAAIWPSGRVPDSFFEPVRSEVPVLLFSGSHDPSTAPRWGEEAARHLPNSLHVVVPGGHGVFGPEVQRLDQAFLEAGAVEGLDRSEVDALTLPPLALPETVDGD